MKEVRSLRWTTQEIQEWMKSAGTVNTLCGSTVVDGYRDYAYHCPECFVIATNLLNGNE